MKKVSVLFITIMMLLALLPTAIAESNVVEFTDLPTNHWSYEFVLEGVKAGIIDGYEDNTFRPSKEVTQAEMIKILVSSLSKEPINTEGITIWYEAFYDYAKENQWHFVNNVHNKVISRGDAARTIASAFNREIDNENDAIQFLLNEDLSDGKSSATVEGYDAQGTLTRAEAIKFVLTVRDYAIELEANETQEDIVIDDEIEDDIPMYSTEERAQRVAEFAGLDLRISETAGAYHIFDKNIDTSNYQNDAISIVVQITIPFDNYYSWILTRKPMDESLWNMFELILNDFGFEELGEVKRLAFTEVPKALRRERIPTEEMTISNEKWIIKCSKNNQEFHLLVTEVQNNIE